MTTPWAEAVYTYLEHGGPGVVHRCCGECGDRLVRYRLEIRSDVIHGRPEQVAMSAEIAAVYGHYGQKHPELLPRHHPGPSIVATPHEHHGRS